MDYRDLGSFIVLLNDVRRGIVGAYRLRKMARNPEFKRTLKYLGAGMLVGTIVVLGVVSTYGVRRLR